jgi:hypothetical protein
VVGDQAAAVSGTVGVSVSVCVAPRIAVVPGAGETAPLLLLYGAPADVGVPGASTSTGRRSDVGTATDVVGLVPTNAPSTLRLPVAVTRTVGLGESVGVRTGVLASSASC